MRLLLIGVAGASLTLANGGHAADCAALGPSTANETIVLQRPTTGDITSPFGLKFHPLFDSMRMHTGIDYDGPIGDPVVAAADGKVITAEYQGGNGRSVLLRHDSGTFETTYSQLSTIAVVPGACVKRGDVIGTRGNTGYSIGPHLHFELKKNGVYIDPVPFIGP